MEVTMLTTQRPRPWLDRLKRLQQDVVSQQQAGKESAKSLAQRTDKTDESPALADKAQAFAAEVAWRVEKLRPCVARLGPLDPVRLPPVRDGVPPLVSQDPVTRDYTYHRHCASCGESREVGQLYHCRACQRAHHLVLLELREAVPGADRGCVLGDAL